MNRLRICRAFFFIAVLCLFGTSYAGKNGRPSSKAYTVEKGDTLWGISERYMNSPFKWPDLWKKNDYIADPNLIFPGNELNIPGWDSPKKEGLPGKKPKKFLIREEKGAASLKVPYFSKEIKTFGKKEVAPMEVKIFVSKNLSASVIKKKMLASCGFIAKGDKIASAVIIGEKLGGLFLFKGREGFAKSGSLTLAPGVSYTAFRYGKDVYHPIGKKKMGRLIRVLGEVKVLSVKGDKAEIVITNSFEEIKKGDLLMSFFSVEVPEEIKTGKSNPVSGVIVAGHGDRKTFAEGNFAYIDLGSANGIFPGQMLTIYNDPGLLKDAMESTSGVAIEVGRFVTLLVADHSSSGFIYKSMLPVEVGFAVKSD